MYALSAAVFYKILILIQNLNVIFYFKLINTYKNQSNKKNQ